MSDVTTVPAGATYQQLCSDCLLPATAGETECAYCESIMGQPSDRPLPFVEAYYSEEEERLYERAEEYLIRGDSVPRDLRVRLRRVQRLCMAITDVYWSVGR